MSIVKTFLEPDTNNGIRCLNVNGEVWFKGKDVAKMLDYANTKQAIAQHVDDEDKVKLTK